MDSGGTRGGLWGGNSSRLASRAASECADTHCSHDVGGKRREVNRGDTTGVVLAGPYSLYPMLRTLRAGLDSLPLWG